MNYEDIYGPAPKAAVYCPSCNEWHQADKVEFLNIEEDIQGRDQMTFTCPSCKYRVKSSVVLKNV